MSGLLNRSLDDIARQEKRAGGRGSPYAVGHRVDAYI